MKCGSPASREACTSSCCCPNTNQKRLSHVCVFCVVVDNPVSFEVSSDANAGIRHLDASRYIASCRKMPVHVETCCLLEIKPLNPHSRRYVWRNNVVFQQAVKYNSSVLWQLSPANVSLALCVCCAPARASLRNP